MSAFKKLLVIVGYMTVISVLTEGFMWVIDNYPARFVFIGSAFFALGMLVIVGVAVYRHVIR